MQQEPKLDFARSLHKVKNSTLVIKIGGAVIDNQQACVNIASQIEQLHKLGAKIMLVHGGGKRVNLALEQAGITPNFYQGQRVTDDATMKIVSRILGDEINSELAQTLQAQGTDVIYGDKTRMLYSVPYIAPEAEGKELTSASPLGRVGKVAAVKEISGLDKSVAVIAPIALDINSRLEYNINADWAAVEIAINYGADYLIYASDQDGILNGEQEVINKISSQQIPQLIEQQVITGGMIPKSLSFITAMDRGLKHILLINGLKPNSIYLALDDSKPEGTYIVA